MSGLTLGGGGGGANVTVGLLSARPAASAGKAFYFATDDAGGTLYYSDGTSWTQMDKRGELGYAQITADQASIGTSVTDITGLAITVTVGARPILLTGWCQVSQQTAASQINLVLAEGATSLADTIITTALSNIYTTFTSARLTPSAGSHTYKLRAGTNANTMTVRGNAVYPAYIQAIEL